MARLTGAAFNAVVNRYPDGRFAPKGFTGLARKALEETPKRAASVRRARVMQSHPQVPQSPADLAADPQVRVTQMRNAVREAYWSILRRSDRSSVRGDVTGFGPGVSLADLREELGGFSRRDVDAALRTFARDPQVRLFPVANTKSRRARDRAAQIVIGGEGHDVVAFRSMDLDPLPGTPEHAAQQAAQEARRRAEEREAQERRRLAQALEEESQRRAEAEPEITRLVGDINTDEARSVYLRFARREIGPDEALAQLRRLTASRSQPSTQLPARRGQRFARLAARAAEIDAAVRTRVSRARDVDFSDIARRVRTASDFSEVLAVTGPLTVAQLRQLIGTELGHPIRRKSRATRRDLFEDLQEYWVGRHG